MGCLNGGQTKLDSEFWSVWPIKSINKKVNYKKLSLRFHMFAI